MSASASVSSSSSSCILCATPLSPRHQASVECEAHQHSVHQNCKSACWKKFDEAIEANVSEEFIRKLKSSTHNCCEKTILKKVINYRIKKYQIEMEKYKCLMGLLTCAAIPVILALGVYSRAAS